MDASSIRSALGKRGVILAGVLVAMLFTSVYPLGRYLAVRAEIGRLEQQDKALNKEAAELSRARDQLKDPVHIERLARERLGYVRPGEVPFAIVDPRTQDDEPARIEVPDVTDATVLERWWTAVRRAVTTL